MAYLDFSNKRYSKDQLADLRAMLVKLNSSTLMPEEAGSITLDEFKEWLEGAVDAYVDENQDSLKGPKGDTGSVGATGVGIQNIANYYAATNTSATPPLSEITSPTIPTMSSYNKYLWKKEITTFTDNSTSSAISLAGVYGDTGSQGAQGPQGPQGATGAAGADGIDGTSSYLHVKYATAINNLGYPEEMSDYSDNAIYMGTLVDNSLLPSDDPSDYTWIKIKGEDGADGRGINIKANEEACTEIGDSYVRASDGHLMILTELPDIFEDAGQFKGDKGDTGAKGDKGDAGDNGEDAIQYYYHVIYVNDLTTGDGYSVTPSNQTYTGTYVDTSSADVATWIESQAKDVKWNYTKGATGAKGDTGETGNGIDTINYFYKVTSDQTKPNASEITSDDIPAMSATDKYLWQKEVISYTDSSSKTTVALIGVHGDTGAKGDTGATGPQGPQGPQGIQGPAGSNGLPTYFHVKYSSVANPTDAQISETPSTYIGTYVDHIEADSTSASAYTWVRFQGEQGIQGPQGIQGIPGTNGTNGKTSYLHIKYAAIDNPTDAQISEVPNTYMGTCVDFNPDDPTTASSYTWVKIKGEQGIQGQQGIQGIQGPQGEQGIPGTNGSNGQTTYFHIKYSAVANPTSSQMTETPSKYIGTYVDFTQTDSTDPSKYTWSQFEGDDGAQGPKGDTGATGATGPQGPQGIQGPAGADGSDGIGIQSITYLYATSQTQSGTKSTYQTTMPTLSATNKYLWQKETINFTSGDPKVTEAIIGTYGDTGSQGPQGIQGVQGPKGDTGATGSQGPKGDAGTDATQYYYHVVYVNDTSTGSGYGTTPNGQLYTGTYTDTTVADAATWTAAQTKGIKWNYTKGSTGAQGPKGDQGIPGVDGTNGKTYYLHIAYANSANGVTDFSTTVAAGREYIGTCTDENINDPTTPASYTWVKIKGEQGIQGDTGNGIESIVYTYATSQTQTGTKTVYQSALPTLSATNKFLWQKETITYTDGAPKVTEAIIGTYGDKGDTGATGEQGPQGVSATHEWNGTVLTITSASGTSSANLKGPAGPAGEKGEDGKDYILTSEDKEEIAQNATSEFRSEVTGLNSSLTEVTETVDAHDALIDETSKIATDNKARLHGYDFRKVDRNPSFILDGDGEASLKQMMDSVDAYPQDAIMLSLEPIIPTASQHNFGIRGQIACDGSYLYVCVAENEWKKIPLQNL